MKSFIISLVIFVLLCGAVTANAIYIHIKTDELLEIANEFPFEIDGNGELFKEKSALFEKEMKKAEFIITMSVTHREAEEIEALFGQVKEKFECNDVSDYLGTRSALCDKLTDLQKSENFSLRGIL